MKKHKILNRFVVSKETVSEIKKFPTKKSLDPDGFIGEFYQVFKEELTAIFLKLFQNLTKLEKREYFQTHSLRPALP